jgi:hypothetical protein
MLRALSFGEVLDGAFTLYRRNFVTFFCTALIPMLVMIGAFLLLGDDLFAGVMSGDPMRSAQAMLGVMPVLFGVGLLTFLVMWGAIARQASQSYLAEPTSIGDGWRAGLGAFFPLLGAALMVIIMLMVAFFAVGIVLGIVMAISGGGGGEAGATVLSFFLFMIGGASYLATISLLFAVVPAVVIEGKGPLQAMGRSFDLARGAIWRIVGLMVVTLLITYLPGFAVMVLTGGFADLFRPSGMPTQGQFMTQQVLGLAVNILTSPFMAAVIVLQYFDRRVRTEGLDVQMAADNLAVAGS